MSEQPKEYCEHWVVCKHAHALLYCPVDATGKHHKECEYDTRSRKHPAPPAPESLCEGCTAEDEMCGKVPSECYSRYQENIEKAKAHDAQVAKAAREHVLNAVLDGNAKRFCPSIDDTHYHCCDVEACIREIFKNYEESLRAQQAGVSES